MRLRNKLSICAAFTAVVAITASPSSGRQLTGSPSAPENKYSTALPPGIASPDTVETRIGTLKFFDGFPDKAIERIDAEGRAGRRIRTDDLLITN